MKYRHIVAISGMSGLYQLLNTKNNGAFVKSLEDHSNKFISSRTNQVTPLESIEIYTVGENIYLHEVLEKLKTVDEAIAKLNFKNTQEFVSLFAQAVPEYDTEKVYNSDIKKILKWYGLLKKNDLLDFSEYQQQEDTEALTEEATPEVAEKPAKKASKKAAESTDEVVEKPKKTRAKKADAETVATEEASAPKKTTTKKAAKKKED